MDDTTFPLMTRRQFVEFVQRQTGIPLTYSRLMKDGAIGRAPRPTAIFGKRYLYSEADALSYAKALVRSTETIGAAAMSAIARARSICATGWAARPTRYAVVMCWSEGECRGGLQHG
jgi:hypothetical protein